MYIYVYIYIFLQKPLLFSRTINISIRTVNIITSGNNTLANSNTINIYFQYLLPINHNKRYFANYYQASNAKNLPEKLTNVCRHIFFMKNEIIKKTET